MNIKIAPSILSADFANLERDIRKIDTADYVHVDIMDGEVVPNISIGIPVLKSIRKVTDMFLDVHLMITQPVRYVEQFCDAGADLVTVHVEADFPENIQAAIDKIHAKGKKAGIVLKPKTTWEAVLPYIDQVELILVMTVEPGFGGHDQDQLHLVDEGQDGAGRGLGLDDHTGLFALGVDLVEGGENILLGVRLHMAGDDVRAGVAELLYIADRALDHQMDIQRQARMLFDSAKHLRPESDRRHKHAVHYIAVNIIRSAQLHFMYGVPHIGKIGR